jgi:hypothetical protein
MRWKRIRIVVAAATLACAVPQAASAAPEFIGFDADTAFVNLGGSFTSVDSPAVRFFDTVGADLIIFNAPITNNSNALVVGSDTDDSGLRIEIGFEASAISMDIGNDNAAFLFGGEFAVLSVYASLDATGPALAQASVLLNANGLLDQTIMVDGVVFRSAILRYAVDPRVGLTELVDNVSVTSAIPEPTAAMVFGAGALVMGAAFRRRAVRSGAFGAMRG